VLGLRTCDLDIGLELGPSDFDISLISYLSGHHTVADVIVIILIN